jgi:hypothetical protein
MEAYVPRTGWVPTELHTSHIEKFWSRATRIDYSKQRGELDHKDDQYYREEDWSRG